MADRRDVYGEVHRQSFHDVLTDLPNRALFVDRLDQAIQRRDRHDECLAVLFVDLDRFKRVNDTLSHSRGDELLVETARRVSSAVRAGDTVARIGSDEFLVLAEDVRDAEEALAIGGRILEAVAQPFAIAHLEVVVTASVGVVTLEEAGEAETIVRDAGLAMSRAKERGGARVVLFEPAMRDEPASRLGIEQALRTAVAEQRLKVVYQPQVDLVDGALVGVEALVRWGDARTAPTLPSELVGVAAEIGLLDEISWFVLGEACRTIAALRSGEGNGEVVIAVNLGARQLGHGELVERVTTAAHDAGIPFDALVLEVTETDVVDDGALANFEALRASGVRASLDDFGTGWSSLQRLIRLPVDELKIDQSFVAGIGVEPWCDAVVRAVASLTDELGLRLVAEGVERDDQRDRLVELGCRIGQGWLLGPPQPAGALLAGRPPPR